VSSPFQAALEARDLDGLRACAKADLHVHAGVTSGDRAFLKERTGLDIRPVDRVLASMDDMHAWVRGQAGDRFARMPGRMLGIEATFVQARRDGVTRLEAGEDVWGITLHDGSAQAVWAMLQAAICGLLASGADWVEFAALRDAAGISDSVLSKQSRLLEDAGYVEVRKGAAGRRPRTWFRLTPNGRKVFQAHVAWLQQAARVPPEDPPDDTAAPARSAVHATNERS
jgi:DNA-binding MarR family transcriptional regulator